MHHRVSGIDVERFLLPRGVNEGEIDEDRVPYRSIRVERVRQRSLRRECVNLRSFRVRCDAGQRRTEADSVNHRRASPCIRFRFFFSR